MKILAAIPNLKSGGAERVVANLSLEWSKKHEVEIIVFDDENIAYEYGGRLTSIKIKARPNIIVKAFVFFWRIIYLIKYLRLNQFDKIISFTESFNFPITLAALLTNNLKILTISIRNDPNKLQIFYKIFIPFIYNLPRKIVCVSKGVEKTFKEKYINNKSVVTIENPPPDENLIKNIKLDDNLVNLPKKYILGVGRLVNQKGFDRLIKSFAKLNVSDLKLIIVGEGYERKNLINLAKNLAVDNHLIMPGNIKNIWQIYKNAECLVLTSRYEGYPNVIKEAMSQNCPVIAVNCEYGPSEIIKNNYNGYLVENYSEIELIKSILKLLKNKKERNLLVKNASLYLKTNSLKNIAAKWLSQ